MHHGIKSSQKEQTNAEALFIKALVDVSFFTNNFSGNLQIWKNVSKNFIWNSNSFKFFY